MSPLTIDQFPKLINRWPKLGAEGWSRAMFPLIFYSMRAQKFWCVQTFLEMTNICAKTNEKILAF